MTQRHWLILFGIFLISVVVRLPNLNRPLSKHHEFTTAMTLISLQNWADHGLSTYHYSPSTSFEGAANLNIRNLTSYSVEDEGRFYYLSFPPLGYLLPYGVFTLAGVYPSPIALQLFNLLFHLISCLLIYQIVVMLSRKQGRLAEDSLDFGGLVAFVCYLFSPTALWFHGNVYMSDLFVSNFFILGVWVLVRMYLHPRRLMVPALLIAVFLVVYTEWLGCFFAFGAFVATVALAFRLDRERQRYWLAASLACVLGIFLGLGITFLQYSSIAGWEAFWGYFENRFLIRSASKTTESAFLTLLYYFRVCKHIFWHYVTGFLPALLLGFALIAWRFKQQSINNEQKTASRKQETVNRKIGAILFWCVGGFSVFMHHFIFLEYTLGHNFSVLKGGLLIAVGVGMLTNQLPRTVWLKVGVAAMLLFCVLQYYYINRPGEIGQNGDRYDMMQQLGEQINAQVDSDEVVFLKGYKVEPQVMYYARRNMQRVDNVSQAKQVLQSQGLKRGKLFTIDYYKIKQVQSISIE